MSEFVLFPYRPCRKLTDRAPENSESQLVIHRVLALGFPLRLSFTYHTVVARLKLQLPEVFPRMPKAESQSQTENVTTAAQQAMKGSSCCRGIGSPSPVPSLWARKLSQLFCSSLGRHIPPAPPGRPNPLAAMSFSWLLDMSCRLLLVVQQRSH